MRLLSNDNHLRSFLGTPHETAILCTFAESRCNVLNCYPDSDNELRVASFALARAISSMLFGTQPTDPITFTAMALLLTAVALAAGYLPARRDSRTNPISALRSN
jgi:hypothetical protein